MKLVNVTQLSALGKGAIGLIVTLGALLNIPAVAAIASQHPHVMAVGGFITTLAALLVNPTVQKILGVTVEQQNAAGEQITSTTTVTKG